MKYYCTSSYGFCIQKLIFICVMLRNSLLKTILISDFILYFFVHYSSLNYSNRFFLTNQTTILKMQLLLTKTNKNALSSFLFVN